MTAGVFQKHRRCASVAAFAQGAQQHRFHWRRSFADLLEDRLIHTRPAQLGERIAGGVAFSRCTLGRRLSERREHRGIFQSRQRLPCGHPDAKVRASGSGSDGRQCLRAQLEARIQHGHL
ncbi:MAG: hypothetical protein V9H26_13325 [Verrucomicrobiota bacterium]